MNERRFGHEQESYTHVSLSDFLASEIDAYLGNQRLGNHTDAIAIGKLRAMVLEQPELASRQITAGEASNLKGLIHGYLQRKESPEEGLENIMDLLSLFDNKQ